MIFFNINTIYVKNSDFETINKKILENKEYFKKYFDNEKNVQNINEFIDKLCNIFSWTNLDNPFFEHRKENNSSWKSILNIYYSQYVMGKTIKEMVIYFKRWNDKKNITYYKTEIKGKIQLTTSQYNIKNEKNNKATYSDLANHCINIVNEWIEWKLSSFIHYINLILLESGEDIDMESNIENTNNELEKELFSLGIERTIIKIFYLILVMLKVFMN